jgi:hypothetical protein
MSERQLVRREGRDGKREATGKFKLCFLCVWIALLRHAPSVELDSPLSYLGDSTVLVCDNHKQALPTVDKSAS